MSMALEHASPVPLYYQLERQLADRIASGTYSGGLPGELELMSEFAVSRGTVRQALERLARRGLIVRQRGRGSFVAPIPFEYPVGRFYRLAHELSERGIAESSRLLGRATVRPPARVARRLGLAVGTRCLRLVRLRLAGDRPLLLETSHLPDGLAPSLLHVDLSHGSIYDVLEQDGVHLTRVTEEVNGVVLRAEEAEPFGLEPGVPALALERLTWTADRVAEHRLVLAPSDRVTLTATWGADAADR